MKIGGDTETGCTSPPCPTIEEEAAARIAGDALLAAQIEAEEAARVAADEALQDQIDQIEEGDVDSVNGLTGAVVLDGDNVFIEGSTGVTVGEAIDGLAADHPATTDVLRAGYQVATYDEFHGPDRELAGTLDPTGSEYSISGASDRIFVADGELDIAAQLDAVSILYLQVPQVRMVAAEWSLGPLVPDSQSGVIVGFADDGFSNGSTQLAIFVPDAGDVWSWLLFVIQDDDPNPAIEHYIAQGTLEMDLVVGQRYHHALEWVHRGNGTVRCWLPDGQCLTITDPRIALYGRGEECGWQVRRDNTAPNLGGPVVWHSIATGVDPEVPNPTGIPSSLRMLGDSATMVRSDFNLDPAADVEFVVLGVPDDLTPTATMCLLSQWGGAGDRQIRLNRTTTGRIQLQYSLDGTAIISTQSSATTSAGANGVKVGRRVGTGQVYFQETFDDGVTWSDFGASPVAGTAGVLHASPSPLLVAHAAGSSWTGVMRYASASQTVGAPGTPSAALVSVDFRETWLTNHYLDALGNPWVLEGTGYAWLLSGVPFTRDHATEMALTVGLTGEDTVPRGAIRADGRYEAGSGTGTRDTFMERASAGVWRITAPSATPQPAPGFDIHNGFNGNWTADDVLGRLDYSSADTGGGGAGIKAFIRAQVGATAGTSVSLRFGTADNATADAVERMRLDHNGLLGIGIVPTSNRGFLQLPAGTTQATGGISWGTDTGLYRSAAGIVRTDNGLSVGATLAVTGATTLNGTTAVNAALTVSANLLAAERASAASAAIAARVIGAAVNQLSIRADGQITWSDGVLAADVNLYRSAADVLRSDDTIWAAALLATSTVIAGSHVQASNTLAAQTRIGPVGPGSEAGIGGGSGLDVVLYRSAADIWRTPDSLTVDANFRVGSTIAGPAVRFDNAGQFQTTVGAAGPASALPATPTKYLKVLDQAGATFVVPVYASV